MVLLPPSGPPSEGTAINSSFFFWLAGCSSLVAACLTTKTPRAVRAVLWLSATVVLLGLAMWLGPMFEQANLDSCFFGAGQGEQSHCVSGADSLPGYSQAWIVAGFVTSALVGAVLLLLREPNEHQTVDVAPGEDSEVRRLKVMADYGCWPIWRDGDVGNLDPASLPLSDNLLSRLAKWQAEFDGSIDWDDPGHSVPFDENRFDREGRSITSVLQAQLGTEARVRYWKDPA